MRPGSASESCPRNGPRPASCEWTSCLFHRDGSGEAETTQRAKPLCWLDLRDVGSPAWIRTTIHGSKGRCPTIRRPGISVLQLPLDQFSFSRQSAATTLVQSPWKPFLAGAGCGLQTRCAVLCVAGGFDSHWLPPASNFGKHSVTASIQVENPFTACRDSARFVVSSESCHDVVAHVFHSGRGQSTGAGSGAV